MLTENMTLTEEMRHEMFKYALELINEDSFSKLHEEDRFSNWYHGYSKIELPYHSDELLFATVYTFATSGVVSTQYYGQQFKSEMVETNFILNYAIDINPPERVMDNENVTLHFSLEKVSMTALRRGSFMAVIMDGSYVGADKTNASRNFTPPAYRRSLNFNRAVSSEDVEQSKLDAMPGFRLSWWYTGAEVTPERKYKDEEMTKQFVR